MRADDQDSLGYRGKVPHLKLAFLGPEFLTWLYFHIDQVGGEIPLSELLATKSPIQETLRIAIGKRMALKPLTSDDIRVSISSPMLDDSGEVWQAIRAGAYIDSLSLDFVLGERIHSLTLNASDGAISNAKTRQLFEINDHDADELSDPSQPTETPKTNWNDEESILIRMSNLDEIEDILNGLFSRFLTRRLAQAFVSQDISAIRQSIAAGLKAKLPNQVAALTEATHAEEEALA
jgi:hypothetical protein